MTKTSFLSEKSYADCISYNLLVLKTKIASFNDHLDKLHVTACSVYQVEEQMLEKKDTDKLFDGSHEICIKKISDDFTALTEAKKTYRDFYNHQGTTSKNTYRVPGFVLISDTENNRNDLDMLVQLCNEVNDLKKVIADLFKAPVTQGDDFVFDRENFFLTYFPHLIKLQVTRNIRLIDDSDITSIDFHWSLKTLSDKTSVTAMMDKITRMCERLRKTADFSSSVDLKIKSLDVTYKLLCSMPQSTELRLRRPIPPQPAVNIRRQNASNINFTCPLPFLIIGKKIDITELKAFKPKKAKINSKYDVIDSSLNLFRVS